MTDATQPPPGSPPPPPGPPPPPPGAAPPPPPQGWAPPPTQGGKLRSLKGLTTSLTIFFWIAAASGAFGVYAAIHRVGFLNDLIDGKLNPFANSTLDKRDNADGLLGGAIAINGLVSLVILVLIIIWTYRALHNARALGRQTMFSPGWGIAGWLIPLAHLVIGPLMLLDLYRKSAPSGEQRGAGIPIVYWITYFVANARFGSFSGDAHLNRPDELKDVRSSNTVSAIGMAASIAAALLAIKVIRTIAADQEALMSGGAVGAPPPPAV
jgi:Domain of unknown function (DUF4328)